MTVDTAEKFDLSPLAPSVELPLPHQWRIFGEFFIGRGQFDAAEHYISALGRSRASAPFAEILKIRMLLARGNMEAAEVCLLSLARNAGARWIPPDLSVFAARRILSESGRRAALEFLDQVNTTADSDASILHAKLMIMARRFTDALSLLGTGGLRAPFPHKAVFLVLHARVMSITKDFKRALISLTRALPYCGTDQRTYYRAARIAEKANNGVLAERWLGIAISAGPPSATVWTAMARIRIGCGNFLGAANSLRSALSLRDNSDDRLLLARCLLESDCYPAALAEVRNLLECEPNHSEAKSLEVRTLIDAGSEAEALKLADDFMARNPLAPCGLALRAEIERLKADEIAMARAVQFVMDERPIPPSYHLVSLEADETKWNFAHAVRAQINVIGALIVREMIGRFSESKIGYLWALLEPCVQIGVMLIIWYIMLRTVPYGLSVGQFTLTGVVAFFFFMTTYQRSQSVMTRFWPLLAHSSVTSLDLILASALLELATQFGIFLMFGLALVVCGDSIRINNPLLVVLCLVMLWACGVGLGLLVDAVSRRVTWAKLVGWAINRKLFFASGLFFVPEMLPKQIEKITMYNPLLHIIQIIRSCFSTQVHTPGLSLSYAVEWCLGVLMFGLAAHLAIRRR